MAQFSTAAREAKKEAAVNFSAIAKSAKFQQLLQQKKAFILPWSIFFFVFYFALPIMTSYSKVLNTPAIGSITWAWVFASAQFIMTWGLCMLYTRKSVQFDSLVEEIKEEARGGERP